MYYIIIDEVLATQLLNDVLETEAIESQHTFQDETSHTEENSKLWQYNAILALIAAVDARYDEFTHPKQRKHFFENVGNDLLSQGFVYSGSQCHQKWKSLTRTYKTVKDNMKKTGRGPMRFMFYKQIDNILGKKPSISCKHTLSSESLHNEVTESAKTVALLDMQDCNPATVENLEPVSELEHHSNPKRRKVTNCKQFLELKKLQEENTMKRHNDLLNLEIKKLEIEKEKLKLLEAINKKL